MAAEDDAPPTDMTAHVQTYDGVIKLLFRGAIAAAIIAALVIWRIS